MSIEKDGAQVTQTAEIISNDSSRVLEALVRQHLSAQLDLPKFEKIVDDILFLFESGTDRLLMKGMEDLDQVKSAQDEMMASLTHELIATRTRSNAVASCMIEAISKLDTNEILLAQLQAQNQSLQVNCHTSFLLESFVTNLIVSGTIDRSETKKAARIPVAAF